MESYKKLLLANKAWVKEKVELRPDFFSDLAVEQKPEFLWIGCSDSRVPAEEITGTEPGEIFVHRNIANLVIHTDFNLLSVLSFAVEHLKVRHIIVCGHYGCGGVKAAMSQKRFGLMNKWLRPIKDTYREHQNELAFYPDQERKTSRLVELNIMAQVQNLARTSIVQKAWKFENRPTLHGWVYGLENGILKDLVKMEPQTKLEDIYTYDFSDEHPEED
jgi:carbonic anhydrase